MPESWITYSVSRPYPYRWITPTAVVGGIVLTALFSLLNYVSSGFYLSLQYVTDPNTTIADASWMDRWPSYFTGQVRPFCQPKEFQINDVFYTNQSALMYTIMSVWTLSDDEMPVLQSGITYMNNPLEDCQIHNINIDYEAEDRKATQYGWNAWGQTLRASITCSIKTEADITYFNLTTDYDFVPTTAQFITGNTYDTQVGLFNFPTRNSTSKASLWWGESLLAQYWSYASRLMQDIRENTNNNLRKGSIYFIQRNAQDIKDLDFWEVDSRFYTNTDVQNRLEYPDRSGVDTYALSGNVSDLAVGNGKASRPLDLDDIWVPSDGLAKSFYSTILVDLGQVNATPNILTNEDDLQFFTQNFTTMQGHPANAQPGPARDSYNALKGQTGPLEISSSIISSKYLCQIPKRKSSGSLFVSILIADLVLIQAAWKLFCFCASSWLTNKHPEAEYCTGCAKGSVGLKEALEGPPEQHSLLPQQNVSYRPVGGSA